MKLPLQITSRNLSLSEAAEQTIRKKAAKLDSFYNSIIGCRVIDESPHRHQQQGNHYNVRIDLTVPGSEIVIKREENKDLNVAIRDAFEAAKRKLKSYSSRQKVTKGGETISFTEEIVDELPTE